MATGPGSDEGKARGRARQSGFWVGGNVFVPSKGASQSVNAYGIHNCPRQRSICVPCCESVSKSVELKLTLEHNAGQVLDDKQIDDFT
jgi:hypothetical protein